VEQTDEGPLSDRSRVGAYSAALLTTVLGIAIGAVLVACSVPPSPSRPQPTNAASTTPGPTLEIPGPPASGVGPAVNGLIAYSSGGDIFIGDPVTGATQAITSGPEPDINPKFSPDGTRIAFVRGTPINGPASLIVVEADGSDARVVVPEGFSQAGSRSSFGPFAWTPDGDGLVVELSFPPATYPHGDGELGLFDASGVREPRLLVPPLTAWIGAIYFNASAQVAPMFRPPDGDLIVNASHLEIFDADLRFVRQLGSESIGQHSTFNPTWSPDGTRILLLLDADVVVFSAESGDARYLGPGWMPLWSPDGSSIAFEDFSHWLPDPEAILDLADETRIAVHDLASGSKRVLESSVSPLKEGATIWTITGNPKHDYYYEGWSWSPDGRSLLILRDHRTRPIVVTVATDTAIELPWETDSFPSWQRVGGP